MRFKHPRIILTNIIVIFTIGAIHIWLEKGKSSQKMDFTARDFTRTLSCHHNFERVEFSKLVYNLSELVTPDDLLEDPEHEFKALHGIGAFSHKDVCFEEMIEYSAIAVDMKHVAMKKRIVIFNAKENKKVTLHVGASVSCSEPRSWPVEFRKEPIPWNYVTLPYPAYFVTVSQPGNLYHLMRDTLIGLYGVLKKTNRLNSTVKNQVYTRKPFIPFYHANSKNISTFGDFFKALGVRSFPVYHAAPDRVCYKHGVFGWVPGSWQEMINYFLKYFKIDDMKLCIGKAQTLTFIERVSTRRVTNKNALLDAAKSLGLSVQSIKLETLPVFKQLETIRCTDILVGVQGAGLQWMKFLRPKRAMIELTFPGWPKLYLPEHKQDGGIGRELSGERDGADWKWLQNTYNHGQPFAKYSLKPQFYNSRYDVNQFVKVLTEIKRELSFGKGH